MNTPATPAITEYKQTLLAKAVDDSIASYIANLQGEELGQVHQLIISEVEKPLMRWAMEYVSGNQTKAAKLLGINRNTLRAKLKQYGML